MANIFASFGTKEFFGQRDTLCDSALNVGFDKAIRLSPEDYRGTDFETRNAHVLSQPRGAGYWLWKPWLIRKVLRSLNPGDLLVYSDAGRNDYYCLNKFPFKLAEMAKNNGSGFLLGPAIFQHGPLSRWVKRDCLIIMDMDHADVLCRPTIQAGWNFWTPSPQAFNFLDEWLKYCEDPRCLTDIPNTFDYSNYKDFMDHRHDQSVATLLSYKLNSPHLDFSDTGVFKLLKLRPQSLLAHYFLRRIDDAENMLRQYSLFALANAFYDLRRSDI